MVELELKEQGQAKNAKKIPKKEYLIEMIHASLLQYDNMDSEVEMREVGSLDSNKKELDGEFEVNSGKRLSDQPLS